VQQLRERLLLGRHVHQPVRDGVRDRRRRVRRVRRERCGRLHRRSVHLRWRDGVRRRPEMPQRAMRVQRNVVSERMLQRQRVHIAVVRNVWRLRHVVRGVRRDARDDVHERRVRMRKRRGMRGRARVLERRVRVQPELVHERLLRRHDVRCAVGERVRTTGHGLLVVRHDGRRHVRQRHLQVRDESGVRRWSTVRRRPVRVQRRVVSERLLRR
jgi:hypothetical protein